jgi:hydroxyethylthiazole kinase
MISSSSVWDDVLAIRQANPLVVNITNTVVTNTTANALLALGASPAMAHAPGDADELAAMAGALVLNIGTPDSTQAEAMRLAGAAANRAGAPIALDPVAAGATTLRRALSRSLLDALRLAAIRGNASEIMHLAGREAHSKGADSAHTGDGADQAARDLALERRCVVCASGAVDVITDGRVTIRLAGGHPLMTKVTGLGCTATALIGAFLAVNPDALAATAHAMAVMKTAGAMAALNAPGPGTLQLRFYDCLYGLTHQDIADKMEVLS